MCAPPTSTIDVSGPSDKTLKQLVAELEESLGMEVSLLSRGSVMLYSSLAPPKDQKEWLAMSVRDAVGAATGVATRDRVVRLQASKLRRMLGDNCSEEVKNHLQGMIEDAEDEVMRLSVADEYGWATMAHAQREARARAKSMHWMDKAQNEAFQKTLADAARKKEEAERKRREEAAQARLKNRRGNRGGRGRGGRGKGQQPNNKPDVKPKDKPNNPRPTKKFKGTCNNCGKYGHKAAACSSKGGG